MGDEELVAWTPDLEVDLFTSMQGHKPVGIARHFHMACITEKLLKERHQVTPQQIWTHLKGMYDLDALDELEDLPFPNAEEEFCLPSEIVEGGSVAGGDDQSDEEPGEGKDTKDIKEVAPPMPSRVTSLVVQSRQSTPDSSKRKRTRQVAGGSSPPASPLPGKRRRV